MRDWYLSNLGIVRYRLRSAAIGVDKRTDQTEVRVGAGDPDAVAESETVSRDAPVMVKMAERSAGEDNIESSEVASRMDETELTDQIADSVSGELPGDTIAFRLTCWRPAEDLLIIDSRKPGTGDDRLIAQLMGNILRSIGRLPGQLDAPELINWPLAGETGLSAAQDLVGMFLLGRYEQQPFTWLLAMGEEIKRCLADSSQVQDVNSNHLRLACGANVVYTCSLSDMIETPAYKQDVWSAIRFLCKPE